MAKFGDRRTGEQLYQSESLLPKSRQQAGLAQTEHYPLNHPGYRLVQTSASEQASSAYSSTRPGYCRESWVRRRLIRFPKSAEKAIIDRATYRAYSGCPSVQKPTHIDRVGYAVKGQQSVEGCAGAVPNESP